MEDIIERFIGNLQKEYDFLEVYLQTLKAQTKYVVAKDTQMINKNVTVFNNLMEDSKSLEQERRLILESIVSHLNIPCDGVNIANIIPLVDKKLAQQLTDKKEQLSDVIRAIILEVETNKFLLRYAINFTHDLLQVTNNALHSDAVYSRDGNKAQRMNQKKILDQKV